MKVTWAVGAVAMIAAVPLPAQVSLRAGGLVARYGGLRSGSAVSISPRIDVVDGPSRATLETSWSQFTSGPWALQAGFETASSWRALGGAFGVSVNASGNVIEQGDWSALLQGTASWGHAIGPLTAGAGVGTGYVRSMLGTSSNQGHLVVSLSARQVLLRGQLVRNRTQRDFADLSTVLTHRQGLLAVEGMAGARFFEGAPAEGVWQASAAVRLAVPVSLEASAGRWPTSPEGFQRGFYASGGVRVAARPKSNAPTITRLGEGRVRVTFVVRGERGVAIGGDWNAWQPVAMRDEGGGRWTIELPLRPGAHRFALRIGEQWRVPEGVPSLPDDFDGRVGLLVVG